MADLQAQAEPTLKTAAEPLPETPVEVVAGSHEASLTTPDEVDWEALDDAAYQKLAEEAVANQHQTGETAGEEAPAEEAPAGEEEVPVVEEVQPPEDDTALVQGKSYRPRLDALPEIEKEAIALRKQLTAAGQDISLKDCLGRVEAKYGIVDGKAPDAPAVVEQPTAASIRNDIAGLRAEFKTAAAAVDTITMAEIQERIEDARDALGIAVQREFETNTSRQTEQQQAVAKKNDAIQKSIAKARQDYPDLANEKSPIAKQWHVVYNRLVAENDPTIHSSNASYLISVIAGQEIGVAPKKAASSNVHPTTRPVQPAPGGLRSSAGTTQTGQFETRLNAAQSQDDYDKLLQEAGIS